MARRPATKSRKRVDPRAPGPRCTRSCDRRERGSTVETSPSSSAAGATRRCRVRRWPPGNPAAPITARSGGAGLEGTDLVLWIRTRATQPLNVTLSPAARDRTGALRKNYGNELRRRGEQARCRRTKAQCGAPVAGNLEVTFLSQPGPVFFPRERGGPRGKSALQLAQRRRGRPLDERRVAP